MFDRKKLPARLLILLALAALLTSSVLGCQPAQKQPASEATGTAEKATTDLILASTTSTQDSGLFDVLIPAFEKAEPYKVKVIAVGSGEAITLGKKKDADVLLVHSPAAEQAFIASGFGEYRKDVMYNDFIIVGPAADPARIKGSTTATEAFTKIAETQSTFVSRGDDSGTHTKEKSIWASATIEPQGAWYLSTGQGMGEVLKIASEKPGYTLTDRATYLSMKDDLQLEILVEGDKKLFNQYGVIPVVDAKNPEGARAFADWITSAEGQAVIKDYGVEEFGEPLFIPNAK